MYCLNIKIIGQVQGVGCRWSIKRYALKNALVGWVKNISSGKVEIQICSDNNKSLEVFLDWLKNESGFAIINIEVNKYTANGSLVDFKIMY